MDTPNPLEVRQLVQRCQTGKDASAFDQLVRLHQSALRYSLRQLTGWDEDLADDIAQDTLLRAYQSIHSFQASAKFSTWLYRIAYNRFIDHCRKKQLPLADSDPPDEPEYLPAEDLHRDLARAMLHLTESQRVALHLSLHRECTHGEIADIMNCPLGTVKSHILRGREKLQEVLAEWRVEQLL